MNRYFIIDKFNTWYDWKLILTAKDITPPEPKTNYVDIDGMSGSLDLSEALTGEITYKDRIISASFWTDNGTRADRNRLLREITTALHGKKVKIIEPDDPTHYFYGRVKITSQNNILPYAEFTIEVTCEPWRYALEDSIRSITVNSDTPVNLIIHNNGVKTVCPVITVTGSVVIIHNGARIPLATGSYKISDLKFTHGVNIVGVSGNGSVKLTYKEADL
jgi:phage-related protein